MARRTLEQWSRHPHQVAGIWWGLVLGSGITGGALVAYITHRLTRPVNPS